jgi:hypothetical protein
MHKNKMPRKFLFIKVNFTQRCFQERDKCIFLVDISIKESLNRESFMVLVNIASLIIRLCTKDHFIMDF